ncbi:MAG TPA: SDR family oxidoreductase [Acidimicrobiales bacterium]|jgi:NAD(P)-dependent dehydrogenase (short-subunit alcohol dehydrogenase family)
MLLEGQAAIVAGIGPGLGREVALLFARNGADLVLGARKRDQCDEVAAAVKDLGRRAEVVSLDITDPEACQAAVDTATGAYGRVDILVNNAFNDGDHTRFDQADMDRWRHTMDVNLWGTLQMTRSVVPVMQAQGGGRIVMINSMSAWRLQPNMGAYTVSKAALESATKMLALELGADGIRVNSVHPGYIWGPSLKRYFAYMAKQRGITPEAVYDEIAGETALKYLAPPEEIAGSVLFLASDLSKPVTGQSLGVNAGHWFH